MKITDNRKNKVLKYEDLEVGEVYQITYTQDTGYSIAMKAYNDTCEKEYIAFVDLLDGTYFELCENEIASIEELNAELIIK